MIKAPYNFVPLSETVVIPEWGPLVSQDVPFSDGISGTISLKLTAESPIFVRNGHSKEDAEEKNSTYSSFSNIEGKYFLPGTAIKGAIRNVLEILSFGKMCLDKNACFAQREWNNKILYPIKSQQNKLRCGWLKINVDGSCKIIDCGVPYRIGQKQLDEYLGSNIFEDNFSQENGLDLTKSQEIAGENIDPKTAYYKYRLIETQSSLENLCDKGFLYEGDSSDESNNRRVILDDNGNLTGTIVLTGQPDKWKYPRPKRLDPKAGKYNEFVFPEKVVASYGISEEEFNQYKFIYADSPDWNYMVEKKPYGDKGIPVFFRIENKKLKDWGLSLLYRIPYEKAPFATLPAMHQGAEKDMAECMFGYTGKDDSLKGRVQFSHFMSNEVFGKINGNPDAEVHLILSFPKASYYPIYIRQKGKDGKISGSYKTYNDGVISGWKRYLRRNETYGSIKKSGDSDDKSESIITTIRPLKDVEFTSFVRFHNLRPEELGALLSALTFHGNQDKCRHLIGMAKPYGYGKVRLEISDIQIHSVGVVNDECLFSPREYMAIFEKYMTDKIGGAWTASPAVSELLTISGNDVPTGNTDFDYMKLEMNGTNEFEVEKSAKSYLQNYSEIIKKKAVVTSLVASCSGAIQRLEEQRMSHEAAAGKRKDELVLQEKERSIEDLRRKAEKEEEELRIAAEQKQKEEAAAKAAKESAGLSILEDVNVRGEYKVSNFKQLKDRVSQYLKKTIKADKVPEDQYANLKTTILRLASSWNSDKPNPWKDRVSECWKYISSITSDDFYDYVFI